MVEQVDARRLHYRTFLSRAGRFRSDFDNLLFASRNRNFSDVLDQVHESPELSADTLIINNLLQRGRLVMGLSIPAGKVDYYMGVEDVDSLPPEGKTNLVIAETVHGDVRGDLVLADNPASAEAIARSYLRRERWLATGANFYVEPIDPEEFVEIAKRKIYMGEYVSPWIMYYGGIGEYYKRKKGVLTLG